MIALVGAMLASVGSVSAAPAISVEFDDSDGVVAPGTTVYVYVRDASTGDDVVSGFTVAEVHVSGELPGTELPNVDVASAAILGKGVEKDGAANDNLTIEIPKGTAPGTYVVTATTNTVSGVTLSDSSDLVVGDPGTGVDSVDISFGKSHIATADAASGSRSCGAAPAAQSDPESDEDKAQTASERVDDANAPAEEPICLTVTVKNSLGKKANDSDVKLLFITAEGGTATGPGLGTASGTEDDTATVGAVNDDSRKAAYSFHVTRGTAGSLTVEVDAGPAESTIELTFTGGATSLSIGDASDVLARSGDAYVAMGTTDIDPNTTGDQFSPAEEGGIIFEVTASDKAGNSVDLAPGAVTAVKITDSDGKDVTSSFNTDNEMQKAGSSQVVQVRVGTKSTKVAAGEYTAEVSLTEVNDSKVSAMFSVADVADDVSLSASAMTSEMIGDVITVTATVTDASGNPVADGTDVDFDVSSSTGLAGIGKGHGANDTVDTVGGMASVKYAVVGHGTSVVSATAGGATGVVVIESTAGMTEPEAMPEEEVGVGCLSNLSGFSTWSCGVESSASEIFGLVSARGVTAIHLHNGTAWVRYSVVDGAMVPGSSDFMVTENDILYISN